MYNKGFAKVNGSTLNYEVTGQGKALVLLHSGFTDLRLWNNQFDYFGRFFKVIRYDIRGFGKSDKPIGPFSHSEDLKELLNYLGIDKAHLVGVSMGGGIAIDFTLQYPKSVETLVLSGPSLSGYKPTIDEESVRRNLAGISIARRDESFLQAVDFMLNDSMWKQHSLEASKRLKDMFMETELKWILTNIEISANPPAYERLSEISKRTLLLVGTDDSKPIKEIAVVLQKGISKLNAIYIENTGHLPNLDQSDEFNKIVLKFLLNNMEKN